MKYIWRCEACGFSGTSQMHKTHHVMYHLMADTLLIELFNEQPPAYYPLKFKEMNA